MNGRTDIRAEVRHFQDEQLGKAMLAEVRQDARTRYHKAFMHYLTTGDRAELKALQANTDPAGGYLTSPEFFAELIDAERQASVMRRICRVLPPIPLAESLEVPRQDSRMTDATWTTELLIGSADTTTPFGEVTFRPNALAKYVKASKKLLRQGGPFAERVITEALAEALAAPAENAYIQGDGAGKPHGLINTAGVATITTATSLTLAAADVKAWIYKLPGRWHAAARALMHVDTASVIAQIDTSGAIIQNGLLLGKYPIEFSDQFPSAGTTPTTLTANTIVAAIGDFSRYWITDALDGTAIDHLIELFADTNQDAFIARQETDGQLVDAGAFALLKIKP